MQYGFQGLTLGFNFGSVRSEKGETHVVQKAGHPCVLHYRQSPIAITCIDDRPFIVSVMPGVGWVGIRVLPPLLCGLPPDQTSWFEIVQLPILQRETSGSKVTNKNTKDADLYFDKTSAKISNLVYKTWFSRYP